jgi:hypothetical protein
MKLVFKKLGSDKGNTWVEGIKIFRLETKLTDSCPIHKKGKNMQHTIFVEN